jgi:hypothetical protein
MATEKQVVANQTNALKSTGPRTTKGKAASSNNATKHGILTKALLLPNENQEAFQAFSDRMRGSLDPQNGIEEFHVDRIISCAWRLRRVLQIEGALMIGEGDGLSINLSVTTTFEGKLAEFFVSRESQILNLSRYEAAIERSLVRSLHELQRLRAQEYGVQSAVPLALDVAHHDEQI